MTSWLKPILMALAFSIAAISYSEAAQLVMTDSRACGYCQKFRREILPSYADTSLGQRAPLRPISIYKRWPQDLKAVKRVRFTPVFILVDNGKEVGRFYGYKGKEDFWARLKALMSYL